MIISENELMNNNLFYETLKFIIRKLQYQEFVSKKDGIHSIELHNPRKEIDITEVLLYADCNKLQRDLYDQIYDWVNQKIENDDGVIKICP